MAELQQLVQNSIPCTREVLRDNYSNLLKVADYCESNYLQVSCSRIETRAQPYCLAE